MLMIKKLFQLMIVQDTQHRIGFGKYYLPLACEYSRKLIEMGQTEIEFHHFSFEVSFWTPLHLFFLFGLKRPVLDGPSSL